MKDIAREANASVSTVARVLSGKGYVSEAVRQRVLEVARRIGYVPNQAARTLKTRQSRALGLLVSDIENPFYSAVARGIETVTRERGYHLILCNTDESPQAEKEYLEFLAERQVEGIFLTPTGQNRRLLRRLSASGIHLVQLDREIGSPELDTIQVDHEAGAYEATSHLVQHGHRRIAIINGPLEITSAARRLAGYRRALTEAGIQEDPSLVHCESFRPDFAGAAVERVMRESDRPTALFLGNNMIAQAALQKLREMRLRVPEQVSVVMFDDPPWAGLLSPGITAVAQPTQLLGSTAADLLLRALRQPEMHPAQPVVLNMRPTLIKRESVQAVRS